MRSLWLYVFSAAVSTSALAAQQATVAQLREYLAHQQSLHSPDNAIAARLNTAEMGERITDLTLAQLETEFHPGSQTAAALQLLADRSAFLAPPAAEQPHREPPTQDQQQAILHAASAFTAAATAHMPNFLATRTTHSFENIAIVNADSVSQSRLHATHSSVCETAYRDGREVPVDEPAAGQPASRSIALGLKSIGEFGQDLSTILADMSMGSVTWAYWEQTAAGQLAVFRYDVPQQDSHYKIYFCCAWNPTINGPSSYNGTPAYRGTVAIDPATGAIHGATLEVEFHGFEPPPHYRIAVQYGAVDIGGRTAILPTRSVTIGGNEFLANKRYWTNLYIDDIRFTNYRRFGSTTRIFTNAPAQ